jgi:hypothetical protein
MLGVSAVTPAGQLAKIRDDIENIKELGWYKNRSDKRKLKMLQELEAEMLAKHNSTDLTWDSAAQHKEVLHNLAKQSAVQLIAQGKVDTLTMRRMASLSKDDFAECVKLSTKMASVINNQTQEAEKSVTPQDIVPDEFMN